MHRSMRDSAPRDQPKRAHCHVSGPCGTRTGSQCSDLWCLLRDNSTITSTAHAPRYHDIHAMIVTVHPNVPDCIRNISIIMGNELFLAGTMLIGCHLWHSHMPCHKCRSSWLLCTCTRPRGRKQELPLQHADPNEQIMVLADCFQSAGKLWLDSILYIFQRGHLLLSGRSMQCCISQGIHTGAHPTKHHKRQMAVTVLWDSF